MANIPMSYRTIERMRWTWSSGQKIVLHPLWFLVYLSVDQLYSSLSVWFLWSPTLVKKWSRIVCVLFPTQLLKILYFVAMIGHSLPTVVVFVVLIKYLIGKNELPSCLSILSLFFYLLAICWSNIVLLFYIRRWNCQHRESCLYKPCSMSMWFYIWCMWF